MNHYHNSMEQLRFTREQKEEMVERLLRPERPRRPVLPLRRIAAVGVAAALVLVGTAGAAGVLRPASEALSSLFGGAPAQTEIIDRIGRPVGASATDNGVTITADAIIGDTYSYAILYTIARDDGTPLAEDLTPINGVLPLSFENFGADVGTHGGAHGSAYFFDADPSDNAVQYVELMTADVPIESGTAKVKFQNLSVYTNSDMSRQELVADGTWKLKFDFAFEDSSVHLPAEQSFQLNGMDATLDEVVISPLPIQVNYTVHNEFQWDEPRTSGRQSEHDREQSYLYFESLPILLTFTDGTTLDLSNAGGGISPSGGETVWQKGTIFDAILTLDGLESVTVADIPLSLPK